MAAVTLVTLLSRLSLLNYNSKCTGVTLKRYETLNKQSGSEWLGMVQGVYHSYNFEARFNEIQRP